MPSGEGQQGRKRGPYRKGRQEAYEEAIRLRHEGMGYRSIGVAVGVPWKTVMGWVRHIPVDWATAHRQAMESRRKPTADLRDNDAIKRRLIEERGRQCEGCRRRTWCGKPIALELHRHVPKPGRRYGEGKIELLCPNCHSLTPSWKKKL